MKTLVGNIKKAVIEMLILKLLAESDMYGYQMTMEFKNRSNGLFIVKEGTLYPILYRLTDGGFISFYEKKTGVRRTLVYYHIEETGRERLQNMLLEYKKSIHLVDFLLNSAQEDIYEQGTS